MAGPLDGLPIKSKGEAVLFDDALPQLAATRIFDPATK